MSTPGQDPFAALLPEGEHEDDEAEPSTLRLRPLAQDEVFLDHWPTEMEHPKKNWLYPEFLKQWHSVGRSSDYPPVAAISAGKKLRADRASLVVIAFRSPITNETRPALVSGAFGKPENVENAQNERQIDNRCVSLGWITHSQLPGLYLDVKYGEDGKGKARFWVYANNITTWKDDNPGKIQRGLSQYIGDEIKKNLHPDIGITPDHGRDGNIWEIALRIWSHQVLQSSGGASHVTPNKPARPVLTGIEKDALADIMRKGTATSEKGDTSVMDPGSWALWGLMTYNTFQIYRTWNKTEEAMKAYTYFTEYMTAHFENVHTWGFWAHYRRQAHHLREDLREWSTDFRHYEPPRNLVKQWRVRYKNKVPIEASPEKWESFPALAVYPDDASKAFALRLGIERARSRQREAFEDCLERVDGVVLAKFLAPRTLDGSYFVELCLDSPEKKLFDTMRHQDKPKVGFRLEVTVQDDMHNGRWNGVEFVGNVQADIKHSSSELCAVVFQRGAGERIPTDTLLRVMVHAPYDGTSCDRQNAAIVEIAKGLRRQSGVDIPLLVLGSQPSISSSQTGALAHISNIPAGRQGFKRAINDYSLNSEQRAACEESFTSDSGHVIVYGPSGSGKTRTIMAAAHAQVCAGKAASPDFSDADRNQYEKRRIICCAPSHDAVDGMLSRVLHQGVPIEGINVCRFNATSMRNRTEHQGNESTPRQSALNVVTNNGANATSAGQSATASAHNATNDHVDDLAAQNDTFGAGKHADLDYPVQRMRFFKKFLEDKSHPWHQNAKDLIFLRRYCKRDDLPQDEAELAVRQRNKLDLVWSERFFNNLDMLFVTNVGSAHPLLIDNFKPDVLVSDDMAQTTLVDVVIPAAAYKEHIKLWIGAGDRDQQGPPAFSRDNNEVYPELMKSLLATWVDDKSLSGKVLLVEQFRMQSEHADLDAFEQRIPNPKDIPDRETAFAESAAPKAKDSKKRSKVDNAGGKGSEGEVEPESKRLRDD